MEQNMKKICTQVLVNNEAPLTFSWTLSHYDRFPIANNTLVN